LVKPDFLETYLRETTYSNLSSVFEAKTMPQFAQPGLWVSTCEYKLFLQGDETVGDPLAPVR